VPAKDYFQGSAEKFEAFQNFYFLNAESTWDRDRSRCHVSECREGFGEASI